MYVCNVCKNVCMYACVAYIHYLHTCIHYITLHYIALHYITLHCSTLHTYRRRNTRKASDQQSGRADRHIGRREKQKRQAVTQDGQLTNGQAGGQAGPRKTKGQPAKIGEGSCPGGRGRARKHRQKSAKRATKSGITDSASPKPAQTCQNQKQKTARSKAGAVPGSTVRVGQKHGKTPRGGLETKRLKQLTAAIHLTGVIPGGRE